MPDQGTLLGYNVFRGTQKAIRLTDDDRRRHMYIIGQTGTGKSWLLKGLIMQDILAGKGLAFIDPHGDAAEELMGMIPKERTEDVIYFAPGETDNPVGLNLFEFQYKEQQDFLIQETIGMLYKLYDPNRQGMIGARYENIFRNAALAVMAGPDGGTFIDIPKLFNDKAYLHQKLKYVTDQPVLDFWLKEMPASERSNDFGEVKGWFVSKFGAFLSNQMMRNIIGQTKSGFDIREVMDEGKILLVNLSKGKTGELNAKLLGMIFVMKFYAAAMGRANIHESQRRDFTLFVDEFQNFSTDTFSDILSEARKYHLSLVVANQFVGQLTDEVRDAVFGNVGTVISSRTGANDADFLVKYFSPVFDSDDMTKMPNQNWVVQTLLNGVPTQPFSMESARIDAKSNDQLSAALKRLSAAKYGRPKASVEKEIFARLKTTEQPKAAFGAGKKAGGQPGGGFGATRRPPITTNTAPLKQNPSESSFLDEWLQKRKSEMATRQPAMSSPPKPVQEPVSRVVEREPIESTPVSKPLTAPAERPLATQNAKKEHIPLSSNDAEDIVVSLSGNRSTTTEDNSAVNNAIQDSQLTEGEIKIDRQGLIHHPPEQEGMHQ